MHLFEMIFAKSVWVEKHELTGQRSDLSATFFYTELQISQRKKKNNCMQKFKKFKNLIIIISYIH